MALKVVNQPLANEVKSCTSDYKSRNKKDLIIMVWT